MTRDAAPTGRSAVLQAMRDADEPMTASRLAKLLGVHVNTVRFHLDSLLAHGQIERAPIESRTPGRPPHAFRVVPGMDPAGPRRYRELAEILAADVESGPDPRRRAIQVGAAWGRRVAERESLDDVSVQQLTAVLDELDFAPEPVSEGAATIRLRHCPFLELSRHRTDIICPIHLGLMQGVLEQRASAITVERLDPFVEPDLCLVHLAESKEIP